MILGFGVLIGLTAKTYRDAPPIPEQVVDPSGETLFTRDDVLAGQQVFLKHGLMENGTIWGHGGYLGPDFSAEYLHTLARDAHDVIAEERFHRRWQDLELVEQEAIRAEVQQLLKYNRFDPDQQVLHFSAPEVISYQHQIQTWREYLASPASSAGLPRDSIEDPRDARSLVAFFAWTAWASVANRPGQTSSYTNNFPFDPAVGNEPPGDALLWSALSLITLLAATALVLFAFGRFSYLGWKGQDDHVHPRLLPGRMTESQKATIKYFVLAMVLFAAQALAGGATAHYRADPESFYGLDLSARLPSQLVRTWHLQLAVFWIVTAYLAGGLLLVPSFGGGDPKGQTRGVNLLFAILVFVIAGSLLGELLGLNQWLGTLWFWLGHQGWEYLDLGRAWQILLAVGLVGWLTLLVRAAAPARQDPERSELASLFLYAALAIPLFYLPAMVFDSTSHFSVVDAWRFWIIHLWVEGFFELFVTVMVAMLFYQLGLVSRLTATRVVYLDAILYLGSGIIGTAHHWYWTGQSSLAMALGALFSAMEVVPLLLLTLDAWDFIKLTRAHCDGCSKKIDIPHHWTFRFLLAVGFWNVVGAGAFGFLINLPIVSYFEVGTMLTPNHGHTALMGVFGMLAVALVVFALRQVATDEEWLGVERSIRLSFWGLNLGLAMMVVSYFLPGGILQLLDVLQHGYWHARSAEFIHSPTMQFIEWLRLPADLVFIGLGVIPLLFAAGTVYARLIKQPSLVSLAKSV